MYDFVKTENGWKVYWGPLPKADPKGTLAAPVTLIRPGPARQPARGRPQTEAPRQAALTK
jgi:hypothetical protein